MAKDENKKVKKENKNGFKNFKLELKKVVWPTPKQLANNTIAVITIVLITAVIVFGLDFVFEKANEYGVERLKSSVESNNEEVGNESNAEEAEQADANSEDTETPAEENAENNEENTSEQNNEVNSEEPKAENQVEE